MRKHFRIALVVLLASTSALTTQSAWANHIDYSKLGPAPWGHYNGEVQLLNTRPDVRDFRSRDVDPIYAIQVPPLDQQKRPIINVPFESDNYNSPPGTILYDPKRPTKSGFESNMMHSQAPKGLPDGSTTNRLGKGFVWGQMAPIVVSVPRVPKGQMVHSAQQGPAQPLRYCDDVNSSGSSSSTTKIDVHAKLEPVLPHRGSLLR